VRRARINTQPRTMAAIPTLRFRFITQGPPRYAGRQADCLIQVGLRKRQRTGAVQNLAVLRWPRYFREVLDCACPLALWLRGRTKRFAALIVSAWHLHLLWRFSCWRLVFS